MKTITYKLDTKQRLDKYLANEFFDISRAVWQKRIKNGEVVVNDCKVTPHYLLQLKDKINFDLIPEEKTIEPDWSLKIIAKTADYLVLDKPAGLIVHPTPNTKFKTLIDLLVQEHPEIKDIGDDPVRPGIVHRLDKDVSGVIVVALTQAMWEHLKQQFHDRKILKIYHALVHQPLTNTQGTIDLKIDRSKDSGKMVARPKSQEGKEAITEYEVIKNYQHYSYIKIILKTGRSHQIRVHFNAIAHPLVGEKLYKPKKLKSNVKLDRLFLHALTLGFEDLSGEYQEFTANLPKELTEIIKLLK